MIFYFSGTGNSKFVAKQIAKETKDQVISLNHFIKQEYNEVFISEDHPYVFVCPTYAWRIPRIVEDFILKTSFKGRKKVYFVLTCGGETANAIHYIKKLCLIKNWELEGFAEVLMPDNYIIMFPGTDKHTAQKMIQDAIPVIKKIAIAIQKENHFMLLQSKGLIGKIESGIVNAAFYNFFVGAKGFYSNEKCTGCGKCEHLCPLNNIKIKNNSPSWGNRCTHCMACISLCPTEAIEYKNNTCGKLRYSFPGLEG